MAPTATPVPTLPSCREPNNAVDTNGDVHDAVGVSPTFELVRSHMGFAAAIATKYSRTLPPDSGYEVTDLTSFAYEGLLQAARNWDPAVGVSFPAFAAHRIKGSIIDNMRHDDHLTRCVRDRVRKYIELMTQHRDQQLAAPSDEQVQHHLNLSRRQFQEFRNILPAVINRPMSLNRSIATDAHDDSDERIDLIDPVDVSSMIVNANASAILLQAISECCDDREAVALDARYFQQQTLEEIGVLIAVTPSRVSALLRDATQRLRTHLKKEWATNDLHDILMCP